MRAIAENMARTFGIDVNQIALHKQLCEMSAECKIIVTLPWSDVLRGRSQFASHNASSHVAPVVGRGRKRKMA